MPIVHCYSSYSPRDPDTARRHRVAKASWLFQRWTEKPIRDEALPRLWREAGRVLPYVRDVFDAGCANEDATTILVYTNADSVMRTDAVPRIASCLQNSEACYGFRTDFHHRLVVPPPDKDFAKGVSYPGSDLVAFRVRWWLANRHAMPDMLLAREGWDPVIRQLVEETNPKSDNRVPGIVAHERHNSEWERAENRYTLRSQLLNLALAKAFFKQRDIDPAQFGLK